jgi:hypothetical protein
MKQRLFDWLFRTYPQNFIFRKPFSGAFTVFVFIFLFAWLYRPVGAHAGSFTNYGVTMALYSAGAAIMVFAVAILLKKIKVYKNKDHWNILHEAGAIAVALLAMGAATYFLAFLVEPPSDRWNFTTFFDSIKRTALIGVIPFLAFSAINFRFWLMGNKIVFSSTEQKDEPNAGDTEKPIRIVSQLKKEELDFLPDQFLYAESEGNYVVFYIDYDGTTERELIRNSMGNITEQFSNKPWFFRSHRAFIINLKKVATAKGNSLGYRVTLTGINKEIPVSRNRTREFMRLLREYKT